MTLPGLDPLSGHVHRKSVQVLRTRLERGEPVLRATTAFAGRKEGILAATDRRILFATSGFWGGKVQHFGYDVLRRLEIEKGLEDATIVLEYGGRSVRFTRVKKGASESIAETVRNRTRRYPQKSAEQLRLERMVHLVEKGSMTEAELEWDIVGILGPPGAGKKSH